MATLKFDVSKLDVDIKGLGRTTRPVFKKIMAMHKRSVEDRFANERGVDGKYWKALVDRKEYHDKTFYPDGKTKLQGSPYEIDKNGLWKKRPLDMRMIGSMQYNYTKDSFTLYNARSYAMYHELGSRGGRIPQRSFMGFSNAQEKKYLGMLSEALAKYTLKQLTKQKGGK